MAERPDRNPIIIPDSEPRQRRQCPKCESENIVGKNISGQILWKCLAKDCNNEWKSGIGQIPVPPREALPPESYIPPVQHVRNMKTNEIEELRRRVDMTPDFRKGALIPDEGEE